MVFQLEGILSMERRIETEGSSREGTIAGKYPERHERCARHNEKETE